jgi:hypothetical protein
MRTLSRTEAAALARNGTKFLVNGRTLDAHAIRSLPPGQGKKQGLLARLCEQMIGVLAEGFTRLSESNDRATRAQLALMEQFADDPAAPAAIALPAPTAQWELEITRDVSRRISQITATSTSDNPSWTFEIVRDHAARPRKIIATPT